MTNKGEEEVSSATLHRHMRYPEPEDRPQYRYRAQVE